MRGQRWMRAWGFMALALALAALVLAVPGPASADVQPIGPAGGADWGLKQSLREYAEDVPGGTIALSGGASRNPDGTFHFPLAGGTYDPESGSTVARFAGAVRLGGNARLDLTIDDLSVEIAAAGPALFADVRDAAAAGGATSYPHVQLAALELGKAEPAVAAGTTTWSAIPAALSFAGAAALANLYPAGKPLDAFGFSYQGPGGKPLPEGWSISGEPVYAQVAGNANPIDARAMFVDRSRGVLHVATPTGLRAFSLDHLIEQGSLAAPLPDAENGYAFDPEYGTVFAVPSTGATGPVRAFTWNPTLKVYAEEAIGLESNSSTKLAYYQPQRILHAIEGVADLVTEESETFSPGAQTAYRTGGGWGFQGVPPVETGGRGITAFAVVGGGDYVATLTARYGSSPAGAVVPSAAQRLHFGNFFEPSAAPGGLPPAPSGGYTLGYTQAHTGPNRSATLVEPSPPAPVSHAVTLTWKENGGAGEFVADGPFELGPMVDGYAVDQANGNGYALQPELGKVSLFEADRLAGTIATPPLGGTALEPALAAASDDVLYFRNDADPAGLYAYQRSAEAPTVGRHPEDVLATLFGPAATAEVEFKAAALDVPAPALRWQTRAPGGGAWLDVVGQAQPVLRVPVSAADAGRRYRAIFANAAGEVATDPASVSVRVLATTSAAGAPADQGAAGELPKRASRRRAARPGLRVAGGAGLVVRANGVATLGRILCRPPQPCTVRAPRRIKLRIGGEAFAARVLVERVLSADSSTPLRVQLPPRARAAIARTRARATVALVASSAEQRLERIVSVALRGRNA